MVFLKHLLNYIKEYKLQSILAPLFKMLEACFDLTVPLIVADIINEGIASSNSKYILTKFALLLVMAILGLLSSFTAQYFAAKAATGASAAIRRDLLQKVQSLSLSEIDKVGSSTLITRMTSDVNQVQNGLNMFLRLFMRSPFIVFGSMILAFTINKELALIFVAAIVVLFVIVFGIVKITNPLYLKVQQNLDGVTNVTEESLNGVRVIRAFSREEKQTRRFDEADGLLLRSQLKVGRIAAVMNPLTYAVVNGVIIAVLWLGSKKIDSGSLLSGDIIALINYISQILVELVKLAMLITQLGRSAAGMNRIGKVLDLQSSMSFVDEAETATSNEAVRFENVSFKYASSPEEALSDISFCAEKGQTIGIIGGTGSGKTTLINLILRFYDATSGTVSLFGNDIQKYSRKKLHELVSVTLQKTALFKGTIRSNLLLANPSATEEELWNALEIAQASDFVKEKPGKLDDPVEQGGANLSGGQKQRLTIARAILSKAKILVLDDSFSALDFATDAALRKALKTLPDDLTTFIISQRVGSLAYADQILVLDDGLLVGHGKHEELLKDCEVYKEIFESQTGKGE